MLARILSIATIVSGITFSGATASLADTPPSYPGTVTAMTGYDDKTLIARLDNAVKANKMGLVTRASATLAASNALRITIPGNMVIGVFHPRFAVRMPKARVAAGIEAPLRFYITENDDGSTSLSYRQPSSIFASYKNTALDRMALELDVIFEKIAGHATGK